MRKRFTQNARNVVIKVGTSVLTQNGRFHPPIINKLAGEITFFLKKGIRISVVSSGAIGAGMTILKLKERPVSMEGLQASAAAGQRYLMECYERAFSRHGFSTAQVLLTWDDLAERKRFMNAKRTLHEIQKRGLVPVINENDTVATDEIRFGDNDRLSSLIAILMEADVQIILSDTNGLYADGKPKNGGSRIRVVERLDEKVFSHVKDGKSPFTVGGMRSKLEAIRMSTGSGIPVFLADGRDRRVLSRIFEARDIGTLFIPGTVKHSKKTGWLFHFLSHIGKRSK